MGNGIHADALPAEGLEVFDDVLGVHVSWFMTYRHVMSSDKNYFSPPFPFVIFYVNVSAWKGKKNQKNRL